MDTENLIPPNLVPFFSIPIKNFNTSLKAWLSQQLNPEKLTFSSNHYLQDWRGMAEVLGFSGIQIDNFQRSRDPFEEVLRNLTSQSPHATVCDLLNALVFCGRYDILEDELFVIFLGKLQKNNEQMTLSLVTRMEQDPQIDSQTDPTDFLTVSEAFSGSTKHFDAYVCFAEEDKDFVARMEKILKDNFNLSLCIPERDLLPGLFKHEALAKLIKERCNKMIVVLSPEYLNSIECVFLTYLASSLEPGMRGSKLVPVVVSKCPIPDVLLPLSMIYFTRSGVDEWNWSRLGNSLKASQMALKRAMVSDSPSTPSKLLVSNLPAITYEQPLLSTDPSDEENMLHSHHHELLSPQVLSTHKEGSSLDKSLTNKHNEQHFVDNYNTKEKKIRFDTRTANLSITSNNLNTFPDCNHDPRFASEPVSKNNYKPHNPKKALSLMNFFKGNKKS